MACNYMAEKPRHSYIPAHGNEGNPKIFYNQCIGNYYNGYWSGIINYYPQYQDNLMPFSGGFMDQPAKLVDAMKLIHNLIKENELEKAARDKLSKRK